MKRLILLLASFLFVFGNAQVVIHELNADSPGTDSADFIEIYSTTAYFDLDGYVLVFFNGSDDSSYASYDLDGYTTDSNGYFVLGHSGVTGVALTLNSSGLQNGADAVALYQANKTDFPNGTAVTTTNLVDAVVYDTDDSDDSGLLIGLNQSTQYNEAAAGDSANHSLQRQADNTFAAGTETPGATNLVLSTNNIQQNTIALYPNPAEGEVSISNLREEAQVFVYDVLGNLRLQTTTFQKIDVEHLSNGVYMVYVVQEDSQSIHKLIKK